MELSVTTRGNKYVVVFLDLFTKWPMVYPTSGQKAERIARLLVEEIVPIFGIPEAHLSLAFRQGDKFSIPSYKRCLQVFRD